MSSFRNAALEVSAILNGAAVRKESPTEGAPPRHTMDRMDAKGVNCKACVDVVSTMRTELRCGGNVMNSLFPFQGRIGSDILPCSSSSICGSFMDHSFVPSRSTPLSDLVS